MHALAEAAVEHRRNIVRRYRAKLGPEKAALQNRKSKMKVRFGLSLEEYDKLLVLQKGVCAVCNQPETSIDFRTKQTKYLAIDHNHHTNMVRGLLCGSCNLGLGKFKDDIKLLEKAINYLTKGGTFCML